MDIESISLSRTSFTFKNQRSVYKGKVRDVYDIGKALIIIASDRISAFDHILSRPIPYKGQVLNQTAAYFLESVKDICPIWLESTPDPNVSIGKKCKPIPIEFVVRGYLAGHAYRQYKQGQRVLCGVALKDGMVEAQRLDNPIITPSTKAMEGHDEDISKEEIIKRKILSKDQWDELEDLSLKIFNRGTEIARERGLILVDTKYEFGMYDGKVCLMDEIHTPDSSRYYIAEGYEEKLLNGEAQKQLSKEFVREWLMAHGFQGKEDQLMPEMPDSFVWEVSKRYIELYEKLTGNVFEKPAQGVNITERIRENLKEYIV